VSSPYTHTHTSKSGVVGFFLKNVLDALREKEESASLSFTIL